MLVPMSWLRVLIPGLSTREVAERLTAAGVEVDAIHRYGAFSDQVVIGRILACAAVAGRLDVHVLDVDIGEGQTRIVSRAGGLSEAIGQLVAVARPEAWILSAEDGAPQLVRAYETYGVLSQGALLSDRELGVGTDHTVLRMFGSGTPGSSVRQALSPAPEWSADEVLEIAVLPNIARCQSVLGVAREIAAVLGLCVPPSHQPPPLAWPARASATEHDLCRRLSTAAISGLCVRPSPDWVQRRLRLCGLRPVNNVVDTSNYVMLELGQPTHAYDADALGDEPLTVRLATLGETLRPLGADPSQPPAELGPDVSIVACGARPVAVAGVVGGLESAVHDGSTRVRLEAACFVNTAVRRSQSAMKIRTEASKRFSRGVDPALTTRAIERYVEILRETCPDLVVGGLTDLSDGADQQVRRIALDAGDLRAALGAEISGEEAARLLNTVGLAATLTGERIEVLATSAREDVSGAHDLIEEVARLRGYDGIAPTFPTDPLPWFSEDDAGRRCETARRAMALAGLQEILTYSMSSAALEARLQAGRPVCERQPHVEILNPHSVERSVMRRTLLAEGLRCVAANLRRVHSCHVFEIGHVHLPEDVGPDEGLPAQPRRLAIIMAGPVEAPNVHVPTPRAAGYYDVLQAAATLAERLGLPAFRLQPSDAAPFQPNACANLMLGDDKVGTIGLVHPRVLEAFEIETPVAAAELDLEALLKRSVAPARIAEPSRFPEVELDLSLVVAKEVLAGQLLDATWGLGIADLADLTVFDAFEGEGLPAGHKALGLRLRLQPQSRTLTMDEGREVLRQTAERLEAVLGAKIRS